MFLGSETNKECKDPFVPFLAGWFLLLGSMAVRTVLSDTRKVYKAE